MSVLNNALSFRSSVIGTKVDRATGALPQSTTAAIFTITGGRVLITSLVGEVTTVIAAGTTPEGKLIYNPDAAGTSFDLCTATSIASDAVGQQYYISGNVASVGALLVAGTVGQANPVLDLPLLLSEGAIEFNMDESVTGAVQWSVTYVPYDDAARLVAA